MCASCAARSPYAWRQRLRSPLPQPCAPPGPRIDLQCAGERARESRSNRNIKDASRRPPSAAVSAAPAQSHARPAGPLSPSCQMPPLAAATLRRPSAPIRSTEPAADHTPSPCRATPLRALTCPMHAAPLRRCPPSGRCPPVPGAPHRTRARRSSDVLRARARRRGGLSRHGRRGHDDHLCGRADCGRRGRPAVLRDDAHTWRVAAAQHAEQRRAARALVGRRRLELHVVVVVIVGAEHGERGADGADEGAEDEHADAEPAEEVEALLGTLRLGDGAGAGRVEHVEPLEVVVGEARARVVLVHRVHEGPPVAGGGVDVLVLQAGRDARQHRIPRRPAVGRVELPARRQLPAVRVLAGGALVGQQLAGKQVGLAQSEQVANLVRGDGLKVVALPARDEDGLVEGPRQHDEQQPHHHAVAAELVGSKQQRFGHARAEGLEVIHQVLVVADDVSQQQQEVGGGDEHGDAPEEEEQRDGEDVDTIDRVLLLELVPPLAEARVQVPAVRVVRVERQPASRDLDHRAWDLVGADLDVWRPAVGREKGRAVLRVRHGLRGRAGSIR
mmetsp:Transcript_12818/g.33595  ORF Transcript_12818/g.33595 Transcript_12818/m.33595 type:complete len:559 (+) Transcript_12818:267-1943(+)